MTIGLTYDLRSDYLKEGYSEEATAEFDRESTIDGIEGALNQLGYKTEQIGHARQLIARISQGHRWDLVFNICEGMHGIGREAQVPAILDLYQIPYTFSDVLVLALTLHKGMTKRVIRDAGIPTPDFLILDDLKQLESIDLVFPLFVKPNAEGTGKGISAESNVKTAEELSSVCRDLLSVYPSGLLIEEFLPGREFTVGILGTGKDAFSVGIMEIVYTRKETNSIYSYQTKSEYEKSVEYQIPEKAIGDQCIRLALEAWNVLGCRDCGRIDIRLDKFGVPNFIEVNPLPGLDKTHSDLPILAYKHGYDYTGIINEIVLSAGKRAGLFITK
jgi:D-alanine-D-alanine ligase